jgi:surface protein
VIDVSGWQTGNSWLSMDAMFNDCRKVKTLDVSSWNTSGVTEFSQTFEACWALEKIIGLENWNTANAMSFDETFLNCSSLKELDLSSWNTHKAKYGNKHLNGDISKGFYITFSGVKSLEKLTLGKDFDFDGDGTVTYKTSLPTPPAKEGYTVKWQNVDTKQTYAASEIPDGVAATYVAYYEDNAKG